MIVELLEARVGYRRSYDIGDEIDLPDDEAARLITAGQAIPVRKRPVETTRRRRSAKVEKA